MNPKILLAFVGGAVLASGIVYMAVRPEPAAKTALVATAPARPASEAAAPEERTGAPVQEQAPAWPGAQAEQRPAPRQKPSAIKGREAARADSPVREARREPPPAAPASVIPAAPQTPQAPAEAPAASIPPPPREEPAPPPPPPPTPHSVTIAAGTMLGIRLGETLSTQNNQPGDTFMGTLSQPLVVDGLVIAERGARVEGRIAELERAGKVKGLARMSLELTRLTTSDGQHVRLRTAAFAKQGDPSMKKDAAKVGIGAALGAAIGAIAGGGKGAAIGTGVGGAAGAGDVLMTRGNDALIPVETRLTFRLEEPITLTERLR